MRDKIAPEKPATRRSCDRGAGSARSCPGRADDSWRRGGRWAVVVLRPGDFPADPEPLRFLEATAGLEAAGLLDEAAASYAAAVLRWPDEPLAHLGLGNNAYLRGDLAAAVTAYRRGISLAPDDPALRNNLAQALLDAGCAMQAATEARTAVELAGGTALEGDARDTLAAITAALQGQDAAGRGKEGDCRAGEASFVRQHVADEAIVRFEEFGVGQCDALLAARLDREDADLEVGGAALRVVYSRLKQEQGSGGKIGLVAVNAFLIIGLVLSPTKILGNGNDFFYCDGMDVFASYERAGRDLSEVIKPGAKIYWEGRIPAIFLYIPDVQVYGPQLNHLHYYFNGGDAKTLLRFGYWNDALAEKWLADADYIMVQPTEMFYLKKETLESGKYVHVLSAPKAEKCRWQSVIQVYQRVDK